MDVVSRTRELIGFNTVSAQSNEAMVARLIEWMEALGFATEVFRRTSVHGGTRLEVIGRRPSHDGRLEGGLMLAGHTDTVPFRLEQKANLAPVQEGTLLYGRGACDMKGGIAGQLEAAARFRGAPLREPLTLAFTSEEEIGCLGAKALLGTGLLRARYAIVGEPTDLEPVRMHKGYCGARVTLTGRACHSSDPRRGVNALKAATRALTALEGLEATLTHDHFRGGPGYFDPDYATLNVGVLNAGVARNVVPETATFTIEMRPLPGQDVDALFRRIERTVIEAGEAAGVVVDFQIVTKDLPMETPAESELVRFLEALTGARSGAVAFSTEGKEYNQMGMESVILGPGSIRQAHQEDENVPLDQLEKSVELYAAAIERFCR